MLLYILIGIAIVYLFKRGIDAYNTSITSISGKEALMQYSSGKSIMIDVRTQPEIAEGKVEGAIEINVTSISFKSEIAKLDKSKSYIVYCRSGMRSLRACRIMEKIGFADVTNVSGGYQGIN